jgi:LuxR family maltose regulon positive regulatory protein
MSGDLAAATKWAQDCGLTYRDAPIFEHEKAHLTLARVLIALGRPGEASQLLERLMGAAESAGRAGAMIEILILQAIAYRMQKRHDSTMIVFERALSMGAREGYVRTFLDEGMPVGELLFQADFADVDKAYVQRLRTTFEEEAGILPASGKELVEPLTRRDMEVLRLVIEGAAKRVRELQLV